LPESQEEDGGRGAPQQPDRPQQDRSSGERRGPEQAPPRRSRDPFDAVMRLSREMDQLVESFFGNRFSFPRFAGSRGNAADIWSPRVDVRQAADSITITAELPGVSREAIQIEATADGIAISGERQQTREEGGSDRGYQLSERSYGSFYRNIPLPENANVDEARANMREGLLEITVPMKPGPGRRRIEISG
ncbi:MAG TPA: Hsp20/alpha crystallin family protein, partial [Steroidobacteraceae bacterium]